MLKSLKRTTRATIDPLPPRGPGWGRSAADLSRRKRGSRVPRTEKWLFVLLLFLSRRAFAEGVDVFRVDLFNGLCGVIYFRRPRVRGEFCSNGSQAGFLSIEVSHNADDPLPLEIGVVR